MAVKNVNTTPRYNPVDHTKKKTTIGRNHAMIAMSSMNKNKRRSYKKYRGQGR